MTTMDAGESEHIPAPPWPCDGCGHMVESVDHIDLAALNGYDPQQSRRLCPTCWSRTVGMAEHDRLVDESQVEFTDHGTARFWHDDHGLVAEEPLVSPERDIHREIAALEQEVNERPENEEGSRDDDAK